MVADGIGAIGQAFQSIGGGIWPMNRADAGGGHVRRCYGELKRNDKEHRRMPVLFLVELLDCDRRGLRCGPELSSRFHVSESRQDFRNCGVPKLLASFATGFCSGLLLSRIGVRIRLLGCGIVERLEGCRRRRPSVGRRIGYAAR